MSTGTMAVREPLAWVAWIRLVAVLGVVSIHTAATNASAAHKGDVRPETILGVFLDIPFVVAVPMFVMVSGALTLDPTRFRGTGAYLRKRVLRTVPAIVFWHVAYVAFLQLWYYPTPLPTARLVQLVLTAKITPHLYFLWITLGLSLLAPVLVRWLAQAPRREQVLTGVALASLAPLTAATRHLRGVPTTAIETPWTWWFPYLGLFVLGWALRDVVLRGVGLLAALVVGLGLDLLVTLQYLGMLRSPRLDEVAPVSYYGATVVTASVLLFLVARATIRPGGALGLLARPAVLRVVDPVAKASLGIYACHFMIMLTLTRLGHFAEPVLSIPALLLRIAVVAVAAVVITLVAGRVPGLNRVF